MAAALYIQFYQDMLNRYKSQFAEFKEVHDRYKREGESVKEEFDLIGRPVQTIIMRTESQLCMKMEQSNRGKYSGALAEKFRELVRQEFPLIDMIGVSVS